MSYSGFDTVFSHKDRPQQGASAQGGAALIRSLQERPISVPMPKLYQEHLPEAELGMRSCANMSVFSEGEPIVFVICAPVNDGKIRYGIKNTLSGEIFKGRLEISRDCNCFRLDFSQCGMGPGHYECKVFIKGNALSCFFGIVAKTDRCAVADSPFAVDHASAWHVKSENRRDYARLLGLSGVKWARERIRLSDIYNDGVQYRFENYDEAFSYIKAEGIKITVCFHDVPEALCCRNGLSVSSLSAVRSFAREIGRHFDGAVDAWEIWNEQDVTHFSCGTPDEYAAFMKAFAIGLKDSGTDALILPGAYARAPEFSVYGPWMMKNGVMDYADAYNFHTYVFPDKDSVPAPDMPVLSEHMNNAEQWGGKAAWLTETGTIITNPDGYDRMTQWYQHAAYLSAASALAAFCGVERTFHFMLPAYGECNAEFGMFTSGHEPLPAFISLCAVCAQLGKGEVLGSTTLPVRGVAFDTGGDEVLMLWNDEPVSVQLPVRLPVVVADMNGGEKCLCPGRDGLSINIGAAPVFVHFNRIPKQLYNRDAAKVRRACAHSLPLPCRLFVRPVFPPDTFPFFPDPKKGEGELITTGYRLESGRSTEILLGCCNFTSQTVCAHPDINAPEGISVSVADAVVLAPGEEKVIPLTITAYGELHGAELYVRLSADGMCGSPACVYIDTVKKQ